MRAAARIALVAMTLTTASSVAAAVDCRGVLQYNYTDDALRGRFHCTFRRSVARQVRATCHDGEPGCDTDGACNGVCRIALCTDPDCTQTVPFEVPLRRGGTAPGKLVFRVGSTRMILRCLPPGSQCGPPLTTTTSTTSTTLPPRPCSGSVSGVVAGDFTCGASLAIGGLGLPALRLQLAGADVAGEAFALLAGDAPGSYDLAHTVLLLDVDLTKPDLPALVAHVNQSDASARVEIESIASVGPYTFAVHGTLDATLPTNAGALHVAAGF